MAAQRPLRHLRRAGDRDEADPGFVSDDNIAGRDPDAGYLDVAVDLYGFDAPFAGDWSNFGGPERIVSARENARRHEHPPETIAPASP